MASEHTESNGPYREPKRPYLIELGDTVYVKTEQCEITVKNGMITHMHQREAMPCKS